MNSSTTMMMSLIDESMIVLQNTSATSMRPAHMREKVKTEAGTPEAALDYSCTQLLQKTTKLESHIDDGLLS